MEQGRKEVARDTRKEEKNENRGIIGKRKKMEENKT